MNDIQKDNQSLKIQLKSHQSSSDQQDNSRQIHKPQQKEKSSSNSSSSLYNQLISNAQLQYRSFEQLISQLQMHGVSYHPNYFCDNDNKHNLHHIQITSLKNTKHYQIVTLTVFLGPYSQTIMIYNIFSSSIFNQIQLLYFGKSTNIYSFDFNDKKFIAKSTSFSDNRKSSNSFKRKEFLDILKEYFVAKIMSVLKIGPKLCKQFYFDIFVSNSDIFFFMEKCQTEKKIKLTDQYQLLLKANLKQMHSLSFLHRDIKPQNIMFSQQYNKFVFIDFGISEYRKQNPGQRILTTFSGTYAYCTEQMKMLFKSRQKQWIDLYYNDAYGLVLSLKQMKNSFKSEHLIEENNQIEEQIEASEFFLELKIKYLIFKNRLQWDCDFAQIQKMPQCFTFRIMKFLYQVKINEKIRKFYNQYLYEICKIENRFLDLKQIFDNQIHFQNYKGKRQFQSIQQQQACYKVQQFYQQLKYENSGKLKLNSFTIKNIEQSLLNKQKIKNLQKAQYQRLLLQYINFKKIQPLITIDKKIDLCYVYIDFNQIKLQKDIYSLSKVQILQIVLAHILNELSQDWKSQKFLLYVKALQNYFILTKNVNFNVLYFIPQALNFIQKQELTSNLKKIQKTLLLSTTLFYFGFKYVSTSTVIQLSKLQKFVQQKIKFYAQMQQKNASADMEVSRFFVEALNYFLVQQKNLSAEASQRLMEKVNIFKPKYPHLINLFNYIEYKALVALSKRDRIHQKKKQKQLILFEQMQNEKEINFLLFDLIPSYRTTDQKKICKKYIQFIDSALQIQEVITEYFCMTRLYYEISRLSQQGKKSNKQQRIIKSIINQNIHLYNVKYQNLIPYLKQSYNLDYFNSKVREQKFLTIPVIFVQFHDYSKSKIKQMLALYESLQQPLYYQTSWNIFYLTLLYTDIQAQFMRILKQREIKSRVLEYNWLIYTQIDSYHKILKIDRRNFVQKDHIFILLFDIIKIKVQKNNEQVIVYLQQRLQLIKSAFQKQSIQQKTYILSSFSLFLHFLNQQNDINLLQRFVRSIYPIIQTKFTTSNLGYSFSSVILTSLTKLSKFDIILNQIIQTSKYYSELFSNSTLNSLSRYFKSVMSNVYSYMKDKQFYHQLKKVIFKVDLKKVPLFGIFLLFCIKPFDRHCILNLIVKSLQHIKFNGKYIILSRLYKQLLKLKNLPYQKKKYFLRKDVRYPSQYSLNVQQMKQKINCITFLGQFKGIFRSKLDKKIIKLGKCCEVYSAVRIVHPLNEVFSHEYLDADYNEGVYEQWESIQW